MGSIAKLGDTISGLATKVDDKQKAAGTIKICIFCRTSVDALFVDEKA